MKYAVKFRRTCIIAILTLILPLLFSLADADITISNVSPADGAIHIEIENNPPDPAGYVNLSWQLNDSDGGGDMEFYMDVYNGTAWVNRLHLTNQNNGTWYHNEDEFPFNQTNQTCQWRIRAKDQTSGIWTNQTFTFTTDRVPDKPIAVSPSNGSYVEKGDIPLSVVVRHPDYTFGWTAIDLDGANDDVRVSDDNSLNFTSSFSVDMALWIEDTPADSKFDAIISKMTDANTGWGVAIYSEDGTTWELHICVDGHNQTVGTATLPTHTWVYLTVVFDNDTHTMYVYRNGTLVYSYNEPNTPSANTADLVIGECSYVGNDKTFDGKIDYIRVYNVALTPNEVMANYYGKNDNGAKRGLVSWWKFDENTGTTTADSWGSNDGTLEDGATWATGSQASTTYYGKIHNVTFYEYPSGRIIGWNYSATGWTNGEIVKCNSTYHLEYEGTKYYWYAKSMDDEYWGDASDVYYVETYYNDTEPTKAYYSQGADIYINPPYTESEPDVVYYSTGAGINVVDLPQYHNMQPANASTGNWLSVELSADVNKTLTDATYWDFSFQTNNTAGGSWATIKTLSQVKVNNSLNSISVWFSGLDWNTTYYWRISAYNATFDRYSISPVYHFTTTPYTDTEPSTVYYSQGVDIYVQPEYNESEPDIVYYSIGSQVNVYNIADLSNPYPADGATGVWLSTPLRIDVNKTGDVMQLDIVFEANDTVNGSWHELYKIAQSVPPNATIQVWFSGLEWNTTYYWRVKAINTTTGMAQYSDIYHFTTTPYNDTEPTKAYYSQGADIYINPIYTTSEPNITYYSVGSQISISPPHPEDPIPADNTAYGSDSRDFSVYISDVDANDTIDKVEFYIGGSKYGEVANVSANSRATLHVSGLTNYTWYQWYVKVYDGNWIITSDTWHYRPANNPPVIDEDPYNGSTNVAVYRKLVGGEWRHFTRLYWNLTDGDGDGMSFRAWVKDPTTGDWIQRWTILDYSMYNGSYYQDEELFNETGQTYYWKVWASDGKNETTQIFHFYTQFFIDFWWTPEYPTTDDTVHFYSLTEGADDFRWEFGDGTNVTGVNETTHQYLLAGYYNVTLWTYNATNDVWGSLTKTIRVDRNITLNTTKEGYAGYNYITWHQEPEKAYNLSKIMSLHNGSWIHKYNKTKEGWDSWVAGYNAGINFTVDTWDTIVVCVGYNDTVRINTTSNLSNIKDTDLSPVYNYLGWCSKNQINVSNWTDVRDGDWVYKFDTVNNTWLSWFTTLHAGDNFRIRPYDGLIIATGNSYRISIGGE